MISTQAQQKQKLSSKNKYLVVQVTDLKVPKVWSIGIGLRRAGVAEW